MYLIASSDAGIGFPPLTRTPSISKAIANLSVMLRSGCSGSTPDTPESEAVSSRLLLALSSSVTVSSPSYGSFSGGPITIGPLYRSDRLASMEDSLRTRVVAVDAMLSTGGEPFDIHLGFVKRGKCGRNSQYFILYVMGRWESHDLWECWNVIMTKVSFGSTVAVYLRYGSLETL